MYPEETMRRVLSDYVRRPDVPAKQLAAIHGVPYATLMSWIRRSETVRRQRGRRPRSKPTPRQQHILDLTTIYSYAEVGRLIGHCRSDVWRIVQRWGTPKKAKPPFNPGDLVTFSTRPGAVTYKVEEAGIASGTVVNQHDMRRVEGFSWWRNGVMAFRVPETKP